MSANDRLSPAAAYIVMVMLCGAGLLGIIWGSGSEGPQTAPETESPPPPAPAPATSRGRPNASATPPPSDAKLQTEDLVVGTGDVVNNGDKLSMKYRGTLLDGTEFDSTAAHNDAPFTFEIGKGRVIKGWDQGILGMKVGGKRKLTIPPELGYGARGAGAKIPPNSTLVFEVELIGVEHPSTP